MSKGTAEKPLVSIVLPTYNGARYLRESLDSCLRQTYDNLELIIVNDGSTDETEEIVLSYDDPRIVYAKHHPNAGLPRSLNVGFALARGDYLTWTCDDNWYADDAIGIMVEELRRREPRVQFVYCDWYVTDPNGKIIGTGAAEPPSRLREHNGVGASFLYTRRVAEAVGPYNPQAFLAEDYEYWLRVFYRFRMMPVHQRLYYCRRHENTLTSRYGPERIEAATRYAREAALRSLPGWRRVWEQTWGMPEFCRWRRHILSGLEDRLRPRRRLGHLLHRLGIERK